MARDVNKVILLGRVGANPELAASTGGRRVATFPLATHRRVQDANGRRREWTEWHRCVAWDAPADALAGRVETSIRKGSRVYVEGRLTYFTPRLPAEPATPGRSGNGGTATRPIAEVQVREMVVVDTGAWPGPASVAESPPPVTDV